MNTPATPAQKSFIKALVNQRINEANDRNSYQLEIELLTYITNNMQMLTKASASALISELKAQYGLLLIENAVERAAPDLVEAFAQFLHDTMTQIYCVKSKEFAELHPDFAAGAAAAFAAGWRIETVEAEEQIPTYAVNFKRVFGGSKDNRLVVLWDYLYRVSE